MKILRLYTENIKRLKAVTITPDGKAVVTIGGKNDAGKSSVLDSIAMALGGKALVPDVPIRRGQKSAKVEIDLGDLKVTRTFTTNGGGNLIVANRDGARFPSPQAMLDKLLGALTFDPLAFERQPAKDQAETLRALVGLNLADLDERRRKLYDERTLVGREQKQAEVHASNKVWHINVPETPLEVNTLLRELETIDEAAAEARRLRAKSDEAHRHVKAFQKQAQDLQDEIQRLARELEEVTAAISQAGDEEAMAADAANEAEAEVPDSRLIRLSIAQAQEVNEKVRSNQLHREAHAMLDSIKANYRALTDQIEAIDAQRAERLSQAKFPVEGLGFDDGGGVTFDGLPFGQASTSARLRVSVAMGLEMNPQLRVLLVRDGSLLDSDNLKMIAEMAEAADAQVWLELMQETPDERTTVFIEDGGVKP